MNIFGVKILAVLFICGLAVGSLTTRRLVRLTGFGVVVIVVSVASIFLWQAHRWDRAFDTIHAGDSSENVRHLMGAPTQDTDGTIGIYDSKRLATDKVQGCTEQYWYYPFFTPECWWIAFDAQGRVIKSYHYISP